MSRTHSASRIGGIAASIGSSGGPHPTYAESSRQIIYDNSMAADSSTIQNFNQHAHSDKDGEKRAQPGGLNMSYERGSVQRSITSDPDGMARQRDASAMTGQLRFSDSGARTATHDAHTMAGGSTAGQAWQPMERASVSPELYTDLIYFTGWRGRP